MKKLKDDRSLTSVILANETSIANLNENVVLKVNGILPIDNEVTIPVGDNVYATNIPMSETDSTTIFDEISAIETMGGSNTEAISSLINDMNDLEDDITTLKNPSFIALGVDGSQIPIPDTASNIFWNEGIKDQRGNLFNTTNNISITITRDCFVKIYIQAVLYVTTINTHDYIDLEIQVNGVTIENGKQLVNFNSTVTQNETWKIFLPRVKLKANDILTFTILNRVGTIVANTNGATEAGYLFIEETN